MKTLQKAIKDLDSETFLKHSKEKSTEEIHNIIKSNIPNTISYIIHKERQTRNNFTEAILSNSEFQSTHKDAHELLREKTEAIQEIEKLFDEIKNSLPQCHSSNLPEDIQCWSHIVRATAEAKSILLEAEQGIESKFKNAKGPSAFLEAIVSEDEYGNKYNADAALSNITQVLSLELKLNAHQNNWIENGIITLPKKPTITDDHIFKSGSIQLYGISWSALEDIATRTLSFGGNVREVLNQDLPEHFQSTKFKRNVVFERSPSEDEVFDYVANRRLLSKISQNLFEILTKLTRATGGNTGKEKELVNTAQKILAQLTLEEILHQEISKDTQLYQDLTLAEWLSGYNTLKEIANKKVEEQDESLLKHSELTSEFKKASIKPERIESLIRHLSFGENSRDLFDCPLIKTTDNEYLLISEIFCANNTITTLISRLSSLRVTFDKKGKSFEKATLEFFKDTEYTCKPLKFKKGGSQYEYDAILKIEDHLFIFECKNTTISGNNPTQARRYSDFIYETIAQVKRLANGLRENPQLIEKEFNLSAPKAKIVPVILNCLPYSRPPIDGVYISDLSALTKFFNSSEINSFTSENGVKKKISTLYKLWSGSSPTANELISYLENPPQIIEALKYIKYIPYPRPTSEESIFFSSVLETDEESKARDYQNHLTTAIQFPLQSPPHSTEEEGSISLAEATT